MGLIQALGATLTTVLADQWREYFYCESLPENVLMRKGVKRTNGKSSNTRGSDNIISNGSIIAVNDGQCMMIVDQGGIVEFTAQPGEFVWDKSTEPSIFYGSLGENLKKTWEVLKKRFTLGGDHRQQIRHGQPRGLPGLLSQHQPGHRDRHPLLRRILLQAHRPHAVL